MKPLDAPQRVLSFADTPPLSLPLRYFISAPLFAALAAAFLCWQGEAGLLSRWSPLTLATTHLLVLGCFSMTMVGALLQMLPVVAGIPVPQGERFGAWVHAGLCGGTLLLGAAFWRGEPWLFGAAMALLAAALLLFLGACTVGMWQYHRPGAGAVVAGIRLSLASLAPTLALGLLLAGAFALPGLAALPLQRLTNLHAMWGLLGWVGLLVIGIAFQVVPMFMLTEPYPARLTGSYAAMLFVLLVLASLTQGVMQTICLALLAGGYAVFGVSTLLLLARRKRPRADPTTLYWRLAMVCLLAAMGLGLWPAQTNALPLALGVLMLAGFTLSAINGMLYKIVPFLAWYHLQELRVQTGRKPPTLQQIVPERHAQWQFGAHAAALLVLLAASHMPALVRPGAALMCAACLGMAFNLGRAALLVRKERLAA